MKKILLTFGMILTSVIYTGCASTTSKQAPRDISSFQSNMPRSILVLPPVNDSPDVKATYSYWSGVTFPVAEAGYYVFPMSVVDSMFKENGVTNGSDAQSIAPQKLREIFGADAALYIRIKEYGSSYKIVQSVTTVSAEAKLVDLKTGTVLWTGHESETRSSDNGNSNLIGALVGAIVEQVSSSLNDHAYPLALSVNSRMLTPTSSDPGRGLLYGPRSPKFQSEGQTQLQTNK